MVGEADGGFDDDVCDVAVFGKDIVYLMGNIVETMCFAAIRTRKSISFHKAHKLLLTNERAIVKVTKDKL